MVLDRSRRPQRAYNNAQESRVEAFFPADDETSPGGDPPNEVGHLDRGRAGGLDLGHRVRLAGRAYLLARRAAPSRA